MRYLTQRDNADMIAKKIIEILREREFINVATCDFSGRPNVAPKLLLKIEDNHIYLVDYIINRTWENLKVNPRVSLSVMDLDNLTGYQINGPVEIIDKGHVYEKIFGELSKKEIELSAKRVVEGIYKDKKHKTFEVGLPEKVVIFKVKIEEIVEIGASGKLTREKL